MNRLKNFLRSDESHGASLLLTLALSFAALSAHSALQEQVIRLPARVTDMYGKVIERELVVTVFEDSAVKSAEKPIAILLHGRSAEPAQRLGMGRAVMKANAQWLTELGFVVAVPTRIGYGVTGGDDAEDSGSCFAKKYPPGYQAAADQTLVVLQHMQQRSDVDKSRAVVIGQSYGGTTAITLAAMNPPGIKATINFAGGGGGDALTQPQQPCGPYWLEKMFARYGETARIPTLWVYTENDQWMGAKYPVQWHQAFMNAGGNGKFVQFGPDGKDGHYMFSQAPDKWRPLVKSFLMEHGLLDEEK